MPELCQKRVAIPIQVGRSIFAASPYDRTVSETSELPNEGWEDFFHNHLIFPPFPTAIWWEKYFFFWPLWQNCVSRELDRLEKWGDNFFSSSAVMTRLCQLGVEVPCKVRSIIGSAFAMSGLWQNQVKWGIQGRRINFPFARLCCVSSMSCKQWFPLHEWGDVFSSTTE